jgi:hypothetical protein
LGETPAHYEGRFEFTVQNIEKVRLLGIGFSTMAGWSEEKPGVRSLTITGITVDGAPLDPSALTTAAAHPGAELGPNGLVLRQDGLFRLKRPAGGWTQLIAEKEPARKPALSKEEAPKKAEAALEVMAEEVRKKAEAARLAADARKKEEAARLKAAEEDRKKAAAARLLAAEQERRKLETARLAAEEKRQVARLEVAKDAGQSEPTVGTNTSASRSCKRFIILEITGYEQSTADLPSGASGRLATLAKSLKDTRCQVRITAYAGMDMFVLLGADEVKPAVERLSKARAATVAKELQRLGIATDQITTATAIGGSPGVFVTVQ